jgi:hypothetical protein
MIKVIKYCIKSNISPNELIELTGKRRWIWVNKICKTKEEFETEQIKNVRKYDTSRWFNSDEELLIFEDKTYAFSNQHGKGTYEVVNRIFEEYPQLNGEIKKNES